nr:PAS domain S-box protein [Arthrospiribacter ruber]
MVLLFESIPTWKKKEKDNLTLLVSRLSSTIDLRLEISQKKAKSQILKNGLNFKNSLLSSIPDLLFVHDKDGNYLEVMGGNVKDLLLSPNEFIGKNVREIQPEDRSNYFFESIRNIENGKVPDPLQYTLETKNGLQVYEARITLFSDDKVIVLVRNITQKSLAEMELKKTRELLEISSSLAKIGAWDFNLLDNTLEWSKTTKTIHEVEDDFVPTLEKAISYYANKEEQKRVSNLVEYAISSGRTFDEEFQIITEKGNPKWVRSLGQAAYENNTCVRIFGTIQDITEKKEAQISKELSEMEYKKLFDFMGQGIVYQSADGKIIKANKAASKILGLSMDELLGRTSTDPRWRAILEDGKPFPGELHPAMRSLKTGKPLKNQIMGVFHPGKNNPTWIMIDSEPEFKNNGKKPFRVLTSFFDITELKKTRLKIEESQANLRAIINSSSEGIFAVDQHLKVNFWNKAAKKQFKILYKSNIEEGKDLLELIPEEQKGFWKKKFEQALLGNESQFNEFSEEKNYNLDFTLNPIKMGDKVLGVAAFVTDMHAIRQYIKTIETQNIALKEIGFIQSHIVRAPVARIMGLVMLLEEGEIEELNTPEILQEIINSCKELDETIREISAKTYHTAQ